MQRTVFERERRGYWSAALVCALEKYGIPVTCTNPAGLADRGSSTATMSYWSGGSRLAFGTSSW